MTRILVDQTLRERLQNLNAPLELCDDRGRVLAHVVPCLDPADHILEPQISQEEIRRRRASNEKTYTTAEVLAHLEQL